MKTLIIPCGGKSSRFPNIRPKFMLCHPSGKLMITEALKGISPGQYDRIIVIMLREHYNTYGHTFSDALVNELKTYIPEPEIVIIDSSKNQPDTVYQGLYVLMDTSTADCPSIVTGQIVIKDCDNYFKMGVMEGNSVAVCNISETNSPANKSYVQIGENNSIVNIVEKQVISNDFCCGAYSFEDVNEFISTYERIRTNANLYVSHIIYAMILGRNKIFFKKEAKDYEDWGTLKDWLAYKKQFKTLFIDLDGVLVKSSSGHFEPLWGSTEAIQKNVDIVNKMYNGGKTTVIITTARSKEFEYDTIRQIHRIGLKYHLIMMQLPHAQRVIINDFSTTNPYPTAVAINIKRNANNLEELLDNS